MTTPRRRFLGWLGASTLAGAVTRPLGAAPVPANRPLTPLSADWDLSWVDRIDRKHRAVFDAPEISDGAGLFRALLWRDQYREVYGTDPKDMNMVLVVRHAAIPMIMSNAFWARFPAGEEAQLKDPTTKEWTKVNPFLATSAGMPPQFANYTMTAFLAEGGIVLACGLAFERIIRYYVGEKLPRPEAVAAARGDIIPGVILQPSGIFAALRAQEAGCSYILASSA